MRWWYFGPDIGRLSTAPTANLLVSGRFDQDANSVHFRQTGYKQDYPSLTITRMMASFLRIYARDVTMLLHPPDDLTRSWAAGLTDGSTLDWEARAEILRRTKQQPRDTRNKEKILAWRPEAELAIHCALPLLEDADAAIRQDGEAILRRVLTPHWRGMRWITPLPPDW